MQIRRSYQRRACNCKSGGPASRRSGPLFFIGFAIVFSLLLLLVLRALLSVGYGASSIYHWCLVFSVCYLSWLVVVLPIVLAWFAMVGFVFHCFVYGAGLVFMGWSMGWLPFSCVGLCYWLVGLSLVSGPLFSLFLLLFLIAFDILLACPSFICLEFWLGFHCFV